MRPGDGRRDDEEQSNVLAALESDLVRYENPLRAARARTALAAYAIGGEGTYGPEHSLADAIEDLVADVLHLGDERGEPIDLSEVAKSALAFYADPLVLPYPFNSQRTQAAFAAREVDMPTCPHEADTNWLIGLVADALYLADLREESIDLDDVLERARAHYENERLVP